MYVEFITRKDIDKINEFDAVFIRETTNVNDYTYEFSRMAYRITSYNVCYTKLLRWLPPLFINAGNADELFDDSRRFYEKARQAGVNITFREGEDMIHCYPLLAPLFPEATKAMNEITAFIKHHM